MSNLKVGLGWLLTEGVNVPATITIKLSEDNTRELTNYTSLASSYHNIRLQMLMVGKDRIINM